MITVLSGLLALVLFGAEGEEDPRAKELPELSREQAEPLAAACREGMRCKEALERVAALQKLAAGRHDAIVKELVKALKDKDRTVRFVAVQLLGTQRGPEVQKALLPIVTAGRSFDLLNASEAVRSLGYVGYGKSGFKILEDLFWKQRAKEVRKAIIEAVGRQKEKEAVSLLIAVLDQPIPKDPNDPNNPPPSFWQEKYDEWIHFKDDAINSLESITGKRFFNSDTAIDWIENEGKKQGLKYTKQPNPWP
ncbi:MAG: HEAT repeat domain-containing protein [Planctomycetes bacterium]|nr:HEAT repeat domain-containing protein [Planctomycetota bacterium]